MSCRILPAILFALAACPSGAAPSATDRDRPNILVVINDDQSWLECSAYGNSSISTPHFDRVAKAGVLFTRGYTSAPSCAPSRAALLTGRNFWELEQGAFIQAWLPAKFATLPDLLEAGGYFAGYTGKGWGPGVSPPSGRTQNPAGQAFNDARVKSPPDGISNIDYAANFAKFLDARPAGKPFYFWAGLMEPHHPHGRDNHQKLGVSPDAIKLPGFTPDTPGVRRHRANYLYEVQHADNTLGALLKLLEDHGELSNTLVIVTADNGTPTPRAKANVYDWGVRVPLAMRWPARVPGRRTVDDFVNFADLAPTILDAAGLPVPSEMSGHSALNVLLSNSAGRVDPSRDFTVAGLEWHGDLPPCGQAARMIRDERFQYIVNYSDGPRFKLTEGKQQPDTDYEKNAATLDVSPLLGAHRDHPSVNRYVALIQAPRPREELYDCAADPDQLKNLADVPEFAEIKQKLRARLEACQRQTRDPRITGDMAVFEETLMFVQGRKAEGYGATKTPQSAPASPRDDAAWLREKGTVIFHDAFEREETGNGMKAIGNGWESATADRVPQIKQADLDGGILKIASATKEAGHSAHIHHEAGFTDGGAIVRFKFPGLNKAESLQCGFVDRELKDVHAGHLCYAILSQSSATLIDHKTGVMNLEIRKQRQAHLDRKEKLPAGLDALLKSKQTNVAWKADGEWHELALVTEGDELRLSLDGKLVARHRSEGYAHPMKRWFSFLVPGTVWIDDVKIWKVK